MFTPAVANYITHFYPLGNTPAVSLTRGLPQGHDADILLLGCGDARHILYTAYSEKDFPSRRLDITCCDSETATIARNVILFSLLVDEEKPVDQKLLWNIYYDLYLSSSTAQLLETHVDALLQAADSLETWRQSKYGAVLSFCDDTTLSLVKDVWRKFAAASNPRTRARLERELERSKDMLAVKFGSPDGPVMTGLRSAAPLAFGSGEPISKIPGIFKQFWENGTLTESGVNVPNPMFAAALSPNILLHYATDPLLGFHLATAFASLAPASPLRPDAVSQDGNVIVNAARAQFNGWVDAFRTRPQHGLKLRFAVADALPLCHVLQLEGATTANLYRRQFDLSSCDLDPQEYGSSGQAPRRFDVIDTSNLADHLGALNLLVAVVPLLKDAASSTLYMETLLGREKTRQADFDALLRADPSTVSLLLGVNVAEHWTNATTVSFVDELLIQSFINQLEEKQIRSQLSWKLRQYLSGQPESYGQIRAEPEPVAKALFQYYLRMFEHENATNLMEIMQLSQEEKRQRVRNSAYPPFHRGSLVSLIKLAQTKVRTDWYQVCRTLIDMIDGDQTLSLGKMYAQELGVQLHMQGLFTEAWLRDEIRHDPGAGGISAWETVPECAVLTLVVPKSAWDKLYAKEGGRMNAPTLQGILSSSRAQTGWQNYYLGMHLAFGKVVASGEANKEDYSITIEKDEDGFRGSSDLIASFYVPSAALQLEPKTAKVGLGVLHTLQNLAVFGEADLGAQLLVYETNLGDSAHAFVTKYIPGMTGHPISCGQVNAPASTLLPETGSLYTTADVDESNGKVLTLTGHLDITSEKGKQLLADKAHIEVRQASPFTIEIVFGEDDLVLPLQYPMPTLKEGSKTRIARKSGYIEVIAPLAQAVDSEPLADFISPTVLGPNSIPITLNSQHINLDSLPILNVEPEKKRANRWLNTLTSLQFSAREKRSRDSMQSINGISSNMRINFKESIFTMFMLASGLQGGQTGLFSLSHPEHGIVMLIFIRSIRIDGAAGSVVADGAVLPITRELLDSGELETFLLLLRNLQICAITVNDVELRLWKRVFPAMVERCRTWDHKPTCEYKKAGAAMPLSLDVDKQFLCSCGNGKLPENFINIPEWESAAKHAVRVAINPVFSVPFVEDIIDGEMLKEGGASLKTMGAEKCRRCGKTKEMAGGKLLHCTRCREVVYCSKECQKIDWGKHRMECKARE